MRRSHETEIKLEVHDPRALKRRLAELSFRPVAARHLESNVLFDFPDLRLRTAQCLLRLRREGERYLLTFKGAPLKSPRYKVRGEIETEVADGNRLREILEGLDLRETFRYEKYRTAYARKGESGKRDAGMLLFDETPIGDYIELEGPAGWIDQVARGLGYARKEYITASYAALYFQRCVARDERPSNMIFAKRKS